MSPTRTTWHGDEIKARSHRAAARSILGMGEQVSREMKVNAHVQSGDLKRTIHLAKPDTMGEVDADATTARDGTHGYKIEVGSWLPYACVENNRGGTHRFADIGFQLAKPTFDGTLVRAWREEGL